MTYWAQVFISFAVLGVLVLLMIAKAAQLRD